MAKTISPAEIEELAARARQASQQPYQKVGEFLHPDDCRDIAEFLESLLADDVGV